jgi:hypothetical protein
MARYTIKELNALNHKTARNLAREQGTPRRRHPSYNDLTEHPTCSTPQCTNPRIVQDWHWTSAKPVYRTVCKSCHDANTARKYAAKHPDAEWVKTVHDVCAHKEGFKSYVDWKNSQHPYRQYRKDHCENLDGHVLGYPCTHTIRLTGQLQVDHIDGNPTNNDPSNLQTLCMMCHYEKTYACGDHASPGRKALGVTY